MLATELNNNVLEETIEKVEKAIVKRSTYKFLQKNLYHEESEVAEDVAEHLTKNGFRCEVKQYGSKFKQLIVRW